MKLSIILLSLFWVLGSSVFGQDLSQRVGDWSRLEGRLQGQPFVMQADYTAFDGQVMEQRDRRWLNGALIGDEVNTLDAQDVLTMDSAGLIVALCENIGGTHEYLNLSVGRTLTCRVTGEALYQVKDNLPGITSLKSLESFISGSIGTTNGSTTMWVGPFPVLGIAKFINGQVEATLTGYHWNN